MSAQISFQLPDWVARYQKQYQPTQSLQKQMAFVIEASRLNVEKQTGGPFAAGVFEIDSGRLVALGVNLVPTGNMSILHAEIVAIALAQQLTGTYDLGRSDLPPLSLVTSCQPCAMCFGAIPWSGVRQVVSGASEVDARRIGFDEGPHHHDWAGALLERGINVIEEVQRDKAVSVLSDYFESGGPIYNSREDSAG